MSEMTNIVLVDMDGVMADFDDGALVDIPQSKRVFKTEFYVTDHYNKKISEKIKAVHDAPGFFEGLKPMSGLFEGWQALIDNGYDPRVDSAPLRSNPTSVEGKIKWLDRVMVPQFGASVIEKATIGKEKWREKGLALLDDRPTVPRGPDGTDVAEWQHILFGWDHLDEVPLADTAFRLLSWHDTDKLLEMLEIIKQSRY
jgi:5'-nucleotidase